MMRYFKKLNQFNRLIWAAALESCTDSDAIEISEEEYLSLVRDPLEEDVLQLLEN